MSGMDCDAARDLLPLLAHDGPTGPERAAVEAHLRTCAECRAEADLLGLLRRHAVKAPPDLAARVLSAYGARARPWRPAARHYALAAATAGVLLLGSLVLRENALRPPVTAPDADVEPPAGLLQAYWPEDDALVAGIAPSLHELSVDELELLLAELDS